MIAIGEAVTLTQFDVDKHRAFGVDSGLLEQAGVRRVSDSAGRDILGHREAGDFAGIEYPYRDPKTGHRVTSRIRLDNPPIDVSGRPSKYLSPRGDNRHLYFPPGSSALLAEISAPVVIVEAEKSALAVAAAARKAQRPVLAIACGGCWSWRGRIGKDVNANGVRVDVKGPLAGFGLVSWDQRSVIVLFDARPNDSVKAARRELGRELRRRGAMVLHAHLPDDDSAINGPDDLVAARGPQALWKAIDDARPADFKRIKSGARSGAIVADDLDNIRLALDRIGVTLTFNELLREVLIDGVPASDVTLDRLWIQINDQLRFKPSQQTLRIIVTDEARGNAFHPIRNYLDSLVWDGTTRLDGWLVSYGGAQPSEYVRAVGSLSLIAAVRRVRQPGCKFDELLVLESAQGTLKSSALRALCPDDAWFSDDLPLGVESKQVIERTAGKWIIEAAEMHGNRGREAEQLKAFLSRQVDGPVRLAYERTPTSVPRQFVMIGTTNSRAAYLKDSTGARRFWPVTVKGFDVDALERDRNQLWAEAAAREVAGVSIRLPPRLWAAAGEQQEQRRASDPWEDLLEPLFTDSDTVAASRIWATLGVEARFQDCRDADRVANIAQRFGFEKLDGKRRLPGMANPVNCWIRSVSARSNQRSE